MTPPKLDMEAIKRRDAWCFEHPAKILYRGISRPDCDRVHLPRVGGMSERDALLDRRDLIAEVERLQACDDHRRNMPIHVIACEECAACLKRSLKYARLGAAYRQTECDALRAQLAQAQKEIERLSADEPNKPICEICREEVTPETSVMGGNFEDGAYPLCLKCAPPCAESNS